MVFIFLAMEEELKMYMRDIKVPECEIKSLDDNKVFIYINTYISRI